MKRPDFQLARVSSHAFRYHKNSQLMTAEISTVMAESERCRHAKITHRVYNDACDQGFEVVSHRTGRVVLFVLNTIDRDREGDVRAWEFVPADAVPGVRNLVVFND